MRRTLASTVLTYAFALMATLGLPLILLALVPLNTFLFYNTPPGPISEAVLMLGFWTLISINPIATAIATEFLLVEEHTLFIFPFILDNGVTLPLPSPWLPFVVFCFVVGALMILFSILAVRRTER
jgi:hypothetical protein